MKKASFSQIVSSSNAASAAFEAYPASRFWWRGILWLHGKPTAPQISEEERRGVLAGGFRFYAQLYRFLAGLFWLVGAAFYWGGLPNTAYWTGASMLASGFLWFASGLGFKGAQALRQRESSAHLLLCTFMVAIIAFLSAIVAVASVVLELQRGVATGLNLGLLAMMWAFGIGSYLIEVLYLVGEACSPKPDF